MDVITEVPRLVDMSIEAVQLAPGQPMAGAWDEQWFTGTGFPRVFYLKYHLYRHYFPLMALGRYRRYLDMSG